MILQNIIFPMENINEKEIYIRSFSEINQPYESGNVLQNEEISTDTYMNAFDIGAWKKYTNIEDLYLVWRFRGKGIIKIYWEMQHKEAVCLVEKTVENLSNRIEKTQYSIPDFSQMEAGVLYFQFQAEADSSIEAWFETKTPEAKQIKLASIICTYQRKAQLEQLIKVMQDINSRTLVDKEEDQMGQRDWLRTIVIDNASELPDAYGEEITVYHNPNTGGSGGFARGMKEVLENLTEFQATNIVLMDDDVILQPECILRLYALLTYIRPEYEQEVIAGRMFRLDRPQIQYTAVEIWNRGDIRHIGWNQDMTDKNCLWNMNENTGGEYSGWWLACFPIEFVKENEPLPFFLHCDDVEYGLRHGGTPIILNGIHVWHETHEYRNVPVMAYYDYRNSLIVNAIYGITERDRDAQWKRFIHKITKAHNKEDYLLEYFLIQAFHDYQRGMKWFMKKDDERIHASLMRKKKVCRYGNSVRWRIVFLREKRRKNG